MGETDNKEVHSDRYISVTVKRRKNTKSYEKEEAFFEELTFKTLKDEKEPAM